MSSKLAVAHALSGYDARVARELQTSPFTGMTGFLLWALPAVELEEHTGVRALVQSSAQQYYHRGYRINQIFVPPHDERAIRFAHFVCHLMSGIPRDFLQALWCLANEDDEQVRLYREAREAHAANMIGEFLAVCGGVHLCIGGVNELSVLQSQIIGRGVNGRGEKVLAHGLSVVYLFDDQSGMLCRMDDLC